MFQRNIGIQNAVCHKNLERCSTKYTNVSEEFTNTERTLSQEFRNSQSTWSQEFGAM
jgi:hypothetical protein